MLDAHAAVVSALGGGTLTPQDAAALSSVLEHTQSTPVRWRIRGPDDDDWDEPGANGRCITEYDPLADEDD